MNTLSLSDTNLMVVYFFAVRAMKALNAGNGMVAIYKSRQLLFCALAYV